MLLCFDAINQFILFGTLFRAELLVSPKTLQLSFERIFEFYCYS